LVARRVFSTKISTGELFEDDLVKSLFVVHEGEDRDQWTATLQMMVEEDENKEDPDDDLFDYYGKQSKVHK
jgi:hypothetical protein